MGEEFNEEIEFQEYKLKIYCPSVLDMYEIDNFLVDVRSKSDEYTLFTERTIISGLAKIRAKNLIEQRFSKYENWEEILKKKLVDETSKNAKARINSKDFEKGKIYTKEILDVNVEQWLDEIEREY